MKALVPKVIGLTFQLTDKPYKKVILYNLDFISCYNSVSSLSI